VSVYHVGMLVVPSAIFLSLAALSPALTVQVHAGQSVSVPMGAQRVPMLLLQLSASCTGEVTLKSITLEHGGMGDRSDLRSLYILDGNRRLTRGRFFSSKQDAVTLSFPSGYSIPACDSSLLSVVADFSSFAAVSGEHRILVRSSTAFDAGSATVSLAGSETSEVRRTVGQSQGSVSVAFLPLVSSVSYGNRRTVARLTMTADGSYDQMIDSLTLTNDGSARGNDLQNLSLETQRGVVLAHLSALSENRASFILSAPYFLERGQTVRLDVRADIRASRRRTIDFSLEEPSDAIVHRATARRS